jgi:NAD(P)-dependent dehydrogenase (short-subunit alcohol dehydrogenase family)
MASHASVLPIVHDARVVVTGATSGLGLAMAKALADADARVGVTSRSRERSQATAKELGAKAVGFELDVREERSVTAFVDQVNRRFGGIDMLVNNAGIGMKTVNPRFLEEPQSFWDVSPDGFREVFETKVTGMFLVSRGVVPLMLNASSGRIVNISMSESTMTRPGYVPYGPSGAAVEALARIMAAELEATPIRVNMLLPGGPTATGMVPDVISAETRARLLAPEIMGPPIVWLASEEAKGVHNERIVAKDFVDWLTHRRGVQA